ncbi:MAG: ABC transporter ATP-binding protein [Verrucomicrobiota bacterium]
MNLIETHQLARRFGKTEAVHDVSFQVPEGEIYALLGPNGAGKTTTIQMLMNIQQPTSGIAKVLGIDSTNLTEREFQKIGYVSENLRLPEWMTLQELIDYFRPMYSTWDTSFEEALIGRFELPLDLKFKHLSRGMQMKAQLLTSLAYRPQLIVLDEPFSGLDPLTRDELIQGILELNSQEGWSVLITSHDLDEVERLSDHVGILNKGKLEVSEEIESLQNRVRNITITHTENIAEVSPPAHWIHYQRQGGVSRFFDLNYQSEASDNLYRNYFQNPAHIQAETLNLREIFVELSKTFRQPYSKKGVLK